MAVAPMLIGVVPFGLVAGATPVAAGLDGWVAVGFSSLVFAGASQLAAIDVLADGGAAVVAALAAWTVNLRMLLYSASLAPWFAGESIGRRAAAAYLMTDQAYLVSVLEWSTETEPGHDDLARRRRWSFYLGAGLTLWAAWQASTVAGVLVGGSVPSSVPLTFAVPLVFLVLLVPTLSRPPAVVAAVVGGVVTVAALELGVGALSIMVGACAGIVAGALVDDDRPLERAAGP